MHVAVTVDGDHLIVDFDGLRRPARDPRPGRRSATPAGTPSPSWPAWSTRRSRRTRGSSTASTCGCPRACCLNPTEGKPVVERDAPPGGRGRRRDRAGHGPDHPRPLRAPDLQVRQPPPDVGGPRPAHRPAVLRPRRRGQRGLGQRGARASTAGARWWPSNGNLIKASAEINETLFPHMLRGRDYLTDSGGAGPVAGRLRHPVRQGGPHPDAGQPVRREPAPRPPGHRRRRLRRARRVHHQRRHRPGGHGRPVGGRRAAGDRRPARLPTSAAAAAGATRWPATRRRCSTTCGTSTCPSRGAGTRLRRRHHRLARGHGPSPSTSRPPQRCGPTGSRRGRPGR